MHEFWKLTGEPQGNAVQWLEDTSGRLLVFSRGECKDRIASALPYCDEDERFDIEREGYEEENIND